MSDKLHTTLEELLPAIEGSQLELLSALFELEQCNSGEMLFSRGDRADTFSIILEGRLAVHKDSGFGEKTTVVALLGSGAVVGEAVIAGVDRRHSSLVAVEDSLLATCSRSRFETLEKDAPELALQLCKKLFYLTSLRLQKSSDRLALIL